MKTTGNHYLQVDKKDVHRAMSLWSSYEQAAVRKKVGGAGSDSTISAFETDAVSRTTKATNNGDLD